MAVDFYAFLDEAEQRKRDLGIDDSEPAIDALRNKGARRSAGKRALLSAIEKRSLSSGKTPRRSYY